jgi:hypothetical protein
MAAPRFFIMSAKGAAPNELLKVSVDDSGAGTAEVVATGGEVAPDPSAKTDEVTGALAVENSAGNDSGLVGSSASGAGIGSFASVATFNETGFGIAAGSGAEIGVGIGVGIGVVTGIGIGVGTGGSTIGSPFEPGFDAASGVRTGA